MIISIVNQKGGCGKSTLAVHLAAWMSEQGKKVIVVDCDAQDAATTWVREAAPGVQIVPLRDPDAILEQLPELARSADVVIADACPGMAEIGRSLLLVADLALIPVCPSALDLRAAQQAARAVKQAQRIRQGPPAATLILNRAQKRTRLSAEALIALGELGLPTSHNVLHSRQAYAEAATQGITVWELGPPAEAARSEVSALFQEIFNDHQTKLDRQP